MVSLICPHRKSGQPDLRKSGQPDLSPSFGDTKSPKSIADPIRTGTQSLPDSHPATHECRLGRPVRVQPLQVRFRQRRVITLARIVSHSSSTKKNPKIFSFPHIPNHLQPNPFFKKRKLHSVTLLCLQKINQVHRLIPGGPFSFSASKRATQKMPAQAVISQGAAAPALFQAGGCHAFRRPPHDPRHQRPPRFLRRTRLRVSLALSMAYQQAETHHLPGHRPGWQRILCAPARPTVQPQNQDQPSRRRYFQQWLCQFARAKRDTKWCGSIRLSKVKRTIGYFDNEESAARASDQAAFETFGEFAFLNFPGGNHTKSPAPSVASEPTRFLLTNQGQTIPTQNGPDALCNPEDFLGLSRLTWQVELFGNIEYAVARLQGHPILMHHLVLRLGARTYSFPPAPKFTQLRLSSQLPPVSKAFRHGSLVVVHLMPPAGDLFERSSAIQNILSGVLYREEAASIFRRSDKEVGIVRPRGSQLIVRNICKRTGVVGRWNPCFALRESDHFFLRTRSSCIRS